jgi:hypothetical protein
VAASLDTLDTDNKRAWDTAHVVCSRFCAEGHATGPALMRLLSDLEDDEVADMLRRINLIYDTVVPRSSK